MVSPGLTQVAEWIYHDVIPWIRSFFADLFANNIFTGMSTEEMQILCIRIALEALLLAGLIKIGQTIARKTGKKRKSSTAAPSKKFKPKQWSPTGWYWDDEKQIWVPPDYLSAESKRRWTWDADKRIWIDNDKTPKS